MYMCKKKLSVSTVLSSEIDVVNSKRYGCTQAHTLHVYICVSVHEIVRVSGLESVDSFHLRLSVVSLN